LRSKSVRRSAAAVSCVRGSRSIPHGAQAEPRGLSLSIGPAMAMNRNLRNTHKLHAA
jgi:hypothetical protein